MTDVNHPKNKYYFPCGHWLAKDEEDGLICRDLMGSKDPLVTMKRMYGKHFGLMTTIC